MSTPITLYTHPISSNAVRTDVVLREKGLSFDKVTVDLFQGEHKKPPLIDLNPRGQVPTLVHGAGDEAVVVYESVATMRFLEELYPTPALMPPASNVKARALSLVRLEQFQSKLDPCNIFGSVVFRKQGRDELGARLDNLLSELGRWNDAVGPSGYLIGDTMTLPDIAIFPVLVQVEAIGYDFAARAPALAKYLAQMKQRPSVVATGWLSAFGQMMKQMAPAQVLAG